MPLLNKATEYIFSVLSEDETVRKFPREFVAETAKWVRSWFLTDEDPKTKAKLEDPARSDDSKKTVIETKLESLIEQEAFRKELETRLTAFETQRERLKNIVVGSDIKADGNVRIGDTGTEQSSDADQKNIVRDSKIRAGGDFRLGDDIVSGNQSVQINHNYFTNPAPKPAPASQPTDFNRRVQDAIAMGRIDEAIELLLEAQHLKQRDKDVVFLLSGRYQSIRRQQTMGVASEQTVNQELARISSGLLELLSL